MTRRSPGEGSIAQSANGRWTVRLELPRGPSGSRRRLLRRARTKTEALRILRELRSEFEDHGAVTSARRTVGEAVASYTEVLETSERKASTVMSHEWMLGLVAHSLGWKKLNDLTVDDCDKFLESASAGLRAGARPIGPGHLRRVRAILVAVLNNELRLGTVNRNVAEQSRRPKVPTARRRKKNRRALSREELRALLSVSSGVNLVAVDLMGRNGLRPAEARALTWASVDLDQCLLTIEAQMDEHDDPDDVKTDDSMRSIRLDQTSADRLADWLTTQDELRSRFSDRWQGRDLVIATRYGTPINRNNLLRSVKRLSGKAGFDCPIVPHELRHTAISHQADSGRSSWEIADWAGTSERMISETYRHQLKEISDLTPADDADLGDES